VHQLLFLLGRQVADVDHDREAVGGGFREREGALAEFDRVHRRDREAERGQLVGFLPTVTVRSCSPSRNALCDLSGMRLISSSRMTSAEASGPNSVIDLAGGGVDHLEADDLGGLQVGAPLDAGELRVADGGEDHAEEGLAHARHAAQQQVARS
jgi:hypothetical protein